MLIFMFCLIIEGVRAEAMKPDWPEKRIQTARQNFVDFVGKMRENPQFNKSRVVGDRDDWEDCHRDYKEAKDKGFMDDEGIERWSKYAVSPQFDEDGWVLGINRQCGCFHPMSMLRVFDPFVGVQVEMSAVSILERGRELWLMHLDANATAKSFEVSYSPIKMTTHGLEPFGLVVIQSSDGRILKLTRTHGVFVFPGIMKKAIEISLDDQLFTQEGSLLSIASLSSESIEDEVVNFETDPKFFKGPLHQEKPLEHIIFASGLAVGDLSWQNRYVRDLGRLLW
jgi:hypothetical protein